MTISNINKPTPPFWGKVQLLCMAVAGLITGAANVAHIEWLQVAGICFGVVGVAIPIFINPKQ